MANFYSVTQIFQKERPLFLREHLNQMYDLLPYFVTKNLIEVPITMFLPLLQLLLVYFVVGFRSGFVYFL